MEKQERIDETVIMFYSGVEQTGLNVEVAFWQAHKHIADICTPVQFQKAIERYIHKNRVKK